MAGGQRMDAVRAAGGPEKAIYLSPQGARLTQHKVEELARRDRLFLLCGRYEGIDERFLEHAVDVAAADTLWVRQVCRNSLRRRMAANSSLRCTHNVKCRQDTDCSSLGHTQDRSLSRMRPWPRAT